jgi:hypothetical protein
MSGWRMRPTALAVDAMTPKFRPAALAIVGATARSAGAEPINQHVVRAAARRVP